MQTCQLSFLNSWTHLLFLVLWLVKVPHSVSSALMITRNVCLACYVIECMFILFDQRKQVFVEIKMVILFSTKFHLYLKICKVLFTITATFSFLLSTALSKLNVIGFFYKNFIALYPFSGKVLKKKLTLVLISCFSQEMQLGDW